MRGRQLEKTPLLRNAVTHRTHAGVAWPRLYARERYKCGTKSWVTAASKGVRLRVRSHNTAQQQNSHHETRPPSALSALPCCRRTPNNRAGTIRGMHCNKASVIPPKKQQQVSPPPSAPLNTPRPSFGDNRRPATPSKQSTQPNPTLTLAYLPPGDGPSPIPSSSCLRHLNSAPGSALARISLKESRSADSHSAAAVVARPSGPAAPAEEEEAA